MNQIEVQIRRYQWMLDDVKGKDKLQADRLRNAILLLSTYQAEKEKINR